MRIMHALSQCTHLAGSGVQHADLRRLDVCVVLVLGCLQQNDAAVERNTATPPEGQDLDGHIAESTHSKRCSNCSRIASAPPTLVRRAASYSTKPNITPPCAVRRRALRSLAATRSLTVSSSSGGQLPRSAPGILLRLQQAWDEQRLVAREAIASASIAMNSCDRAGNGSGFRYS